MKTYTFTQHDRKDWKITIGENSPQSLNDVIDLNSYSKIGVVCDKTTNRLFFDKVSQGLANKQNNINAFIIPSGERSKSFDVLADLYKKMIDSNFDRKSLLIGLGGGVVTDLTGFVAATFMRGIDYINIPTTLLAQVDAAIGGKTGVNFDGLKNMIGVFYQPKAVIIDISTLDTLPNRQLISGKSEMIKYGLIKDKSIFEAFERNDGTILKKDLNSLIEKCALIKAKIIEIDGNDTNDTRATLNFGHTVGHAIEAVSDGSLTHGEAVALGMVFASHISLQRAYINEKEFARIIKVIEKIGLPVKIKIAKEAILDKIQHDKKSVGRKIKWVLLQNIGHATVVDDVTKEEIDKAYTIL